jgi:GNAT superfamily N-acetyltransferase
MRIGQQYSQETLLGTLSLPQLEQLTAVCMDKGIVIVAEIDNRVIGIIAGHVVEGFTMGKFCEEVLWYMDPGHRGAGLLLYGQFMTACREAGCVGVSMSAYNNKYLKAVDRFYKQNGFREVERKYFKEI